MNADVDRLSETAPSGTSTVVLVAGMHRSGTSAVSRLLGHLGLGHGDPDDLLPPAPDNPYGFFEHTGVKHINDRILALHGATWDKPSYLASPGTDWLEIPQMEPLRRDAVTLLQKLTPVQGPRGLVIKDPRLSLTLPFWQALLPDALVVLSMRSPSLVAASLARRNHMPVDQSTLLWIEYTASALTAATPDALIFAEDLVTTPLATVRRLVHDLNLDVPDDEMTTAVQDAIVPDALGSGGPNVETTATGTAAMTLYRLLREQGSTDLVQRVAYSFRNPPKEGARLQSQLTELQERHSQLQAVADGRQEHIRDLNTRLERLQAVARDRQEHIQDLNSRLRKLNNAVREQEQAAAAARNEAIHADREAAAWRARARRHQRNFTRLRNRRSVRATLRLAELSRPVFHTWRKIRTHRQLGMATRGTSSGSHAGDHGPYPPRHPPGGQEAAALVHRLESAPGLTVVIPIYGAVAHVRRCVDSIATQLAPFADVLLIDDCSPGQEDQLALQEIAKGLPRVTLVRNDRNLGFTRTVNRGFELAGDRDVLVLNSDTVLPPLAVQRLRAAAYAYEDVATVTPVSDNAGAFSVPRLGEANDLGGPDGCAELSARLRATGQLHYPTAPTGNGFCLYVRRAALDDAGLFDAEAFPRGYGEENDHAMRLEARGWVHLVEPTTVVHHIRSASFGDEKDELARVGRLVLDQRHPAYTSKVRSWIESDGMTAVREAVTRELGTTTRGQSAVLYVLQEGSGGTPATAIDLAHGISPQYDALVLISNARDLNLHRVEDGKLELLETVRLDTPVVFGESSRDDYLGAVTSIILRYGVAVVHIRHLIRHTFDAVRAARSIGIPTILSLHDFYYVCPTINLMDEHGQFCGGVCTKGDGDCPIAIRWIRDSAPKLKHSGVYSWRDQTRGLLRSVDRIVVTSYVTRDVYVQSFPEVADRIEVVEHGRDFDETTTVLAPTPADNDPIRILFPGNMGIHKGSRVIRALRQADTENRLELHFAGRLRDEDRDLADTYHGTYARDEFEELVRTVRPSFIGLLSTCVETYSHTLSEAWAAGIPVVATPMGAIGERVRRHGGGICVPLDDPAAALAQILEVADEPDTYRELRLQAQRVRIRPVDEMADAFGDLYTRLSHVPADEAQTSSVLGMDLFLRGFPPPYPGSVYVRTLARAEHPDLDGLLESSPREPGPFLSASLQAHGDVVLVQRDAIEPELVDQFLRALRFLDVPLVLDLDDNLLDAALHPDSYWTPERSDGIRSLLEAADLVTVSTPLLGELVEPIAKAVRVEPNHLHDVWWKLDGPPAAGEASARDDDVFRIGYQGSLTHGRDLALLHEAVSLLPPNLRRRVRVEVVGGETGTDHWYERIQVPNDCKPYPHFARWLGDVAPHWDLAVAPLHDGGLNNWKSDLKFLEYSALGLPTIVADLVPYRNLPDDITVKALPDPPTWADAIAQVAADDSARRKMAARARAWVIEHRRMSQHVAQWYSAVRGVV